MYCLHFFVSTGIIEMEILAFGWSELELIFFKILLLDLGEGGLESIVLIVMDAMVADSG
jgi:hypothetical protein